MKSDQELILLGLESVDSMQETSKFIAMTLNEIHNKNEILVILMITLDSFLQQCDDETRTKFNEVKDVMKKNGVIKWMN
jgi:hypothetical protein